MQVLSSWTWMSQMSLVTCSMADRIYSQVLFWYNYYTDHNWKDPSTARTYSCGQTGQGRSSGTTISTRGRNFSCSRTSGRVAASCLPGMSTGTFQGCSSSSRVPSSSLFLCRIWGVLISHTRPKCRHISIATRSRESCHCRFQAGLVSVCPWRPWPATRTWFPQW